MIPPRVWFITGTSSGFGRRLVSIVRERGDHVIATAKRLGDITHFLRDSELPSTNVHCAELDIAVGTTQVKDQIDGIIQASKWGTVDVLVNNAGTGIPGFVEEGGTDLLRFQYQTNVFGTLDVTTAVLPYMRKQKSGTVAFVGSRSAWRTEIKGMGFYGSSKAAVRAIGETMAVELKPFGIRVLIVEPGAFRTEGIYRNAFKALHPIRDYDYHRGTGEQRWRMPAGKQPGDPVKAMNALADVICGEGRAQGKAWPLYLVLGKDADQDVRKKCMRMIQHLDEWGDMVKDVDLNDLD